MALEDVAYEKRKKLNQIMKAEQRARAKKFTPVNSVECQEDCCVQRREFGFSKKEPFKGKNKRLAFMQGFNEARQQRDDTQYAKGIIKGKEQAKHDNEILTKTIIETNKNVHIAPPQTDKTTEEKFDEKFDGVLNPSLSHNIKQFIADELKRVREEELHTLNVYVDEKGELHSISYAQTQALDVYRGKLIERLIAKKYRNDLELVGSKRQFNDTIDEVLTLLKIERE